MSDLISRSAMLEHIDRRIQSIDIAPDPLYRIAWEIIRDYIEYEAPAVDAVEVVRCRECIYRGARDLCPMCVRVYQLDEAGYLDCTVDDGFCHNGAKKDGGEG